MMPFLIFTVLFVILATVLIGGFHAEPRSVSKRELKQTVAKPEWLPPVDDPYWQEYVRRTKA